MGTNVVAVHLLLLIQLGIEFVDTRSEVGRITTESDVKILQELIAASEQRLGSIGASVNSWLTVEDDDTISEICCHNEIVLDDEGGFLGVHDESLNDSSGNDALLGIKVRRRFINEVDVGWKTESEDNGYSLQFSSGESFDFLVDELVKLQWLNDIGLELRKEESGLDLLEEELSDRALELRGDLLRFHADFHSWHLLSSIWVDSSCKQFTERRLSSSVLTHHNNDL